MRHLIQTLIACTSLCAISFAQQGSVPAPTPTAPGASLQNPNNAPTQPQISVSPFGRAPGGPMPQPTNPAMPTQPTNPQMPVQPTNPLMPGQVPTPQLPGQAANPQPPLMTPNSQGLYPNQIAPPIPYGGPNPGAAATPGNLAQSAQARNTNNWRMVNQYGQWWYWAPRGYWMYYNDSAWKQYNP